MPLLSTDPAHPSTPRINHLREARTQIRKAGSALLDVTPLLGPGDLVATRTIEMCDWLLLRLAREGRRVNG